MRAEVATAEVDRSPAWHDARAEVTVVVATCDRSAWVPELLGSLAQQDIPVEVVLVDDASLDAVALPDTELPVLLLRTATRSGPSAARNAGALRRRTPVLLLTDDDCLPDPSWARELRDALAGRAIVQGRTEPVEVPHGPWDRSITVTGTTGLWETCNLAVDAVAFDEVGGFADLGLLGSGSRGFGEDAELGALLARRGAAFAPDAVVRHRWVPADYRDHVRGRARLEGFPGLSRHVELPLVGGVGLSRRSLVTDLGIVGLAATAATPLAAVAAVPWAVRTWRGSPPIPFAWKTCAPSIGCTTLRNSQRGHRHSPRSRRFASRLMKSSCELCSRLRA